MIRKISTVFSGEAVLDAARAFEICLISFPLLVVLLASIAFLCGDVCAPWQWWTSLAVVLALPYFLTAAKPARLANLFFISALAWIFCEAHLISDPASAPDMAICHLPAVRMLIEGWNPAYDPDASAILAQLGLDKWDMRYLHVVFMKNSAWVFSAVSYFFFGSPFSQISTPGFFLEISMLLAAGRFFRAAGWRRSWAWTLFFYASLKLAMTQSNALGAAPLDQALMCAIGTMLFTLARCVISGKMDAIVLFASTLMTATIKPVGVQAAVVAWALWGCVAIYRKRRATVRGVLRAAGWLAGFAALFLAMQYHPYVTSTMRYGHPLYPAKTAVPEKFPAMDLTADFKCVNDDYKQMGVAAKWLNAYASPDLVQWYFNRKSNRRDFHPVVWCWEHTSEKDYPAPLLPGFRIAMWAALAVLAVFRPTRFLAVFCLAALTALPPSLYGYNRYLPYLFVLEGLALTIAVKRAASFNRFCGAAAGLAVLAICGALEFRTLVQKLLYTSHIDEGLPGVMYADARSEAAPAENASSANPGGRIRFFENVNTGEPENLHTHWRKNCIELLMRLLKPGKAPVVYSNPLDCPHTADEMVRVPGYFFRPKTQQEIDLAAKPYLRRVASYLKADMRMVFRGAPERMLRAARNWFK